MTLPSIFERCTPRPEVLAAEGLPDSIFAADLWDVLTGRAHEDYKNPSKFFAGTYPTDNLKLLMREVAERLAGVEGGSPVFRLETGFGGGKTHALIAAVHIAQGGTKLADQLKDYGIGRLPQPGEVRVAAFVGEESDPLGGTEHIVEGQSIRVYTPWGQLALMAGGQAGYEIVREHDLRGIAPSRGDLEAALGDQPVLLLIDELVLYMARAFALRQDHERSQVNSQWATFLQTLFSVAARRPRTAAILTLPSEQDANRRLIGELRQHIPTVLETVDELEQTLGRQARNLSPTQSHERAAVLGRRLFTVVNASGAGEVARAYREYCEEQRTEGILIDGRAFEPGFEEQIQAGYPFHPELIRLFAERLADIPEFQATRGALRLVARTIRAAWDRRTTLGPLPLLQPQHVDLARPELRDEILARLGRNAFERGLDADVVGPAGGTHASEVESGWPWQAATESALVVFLHSLPDGSRGLTAPEVALAVGRPGRDLGYVARGLEETERSAWYMRREGDHFLFRTRASINKRYQERLTQVQGEPGETRTVLDGWIQEVYSGFESFQVIPFPVDQTAISESPDRVRLAIIHYDKEVGAVGGGDRLNFTRGLFSEAGVNRSPRRYRNNLIFLLAEGTRVSSLKEAVAALIAWERVERDVLQEQATLAEAGGTDLRSLQTQARRGDTGVPPEFLALENDLGEVREKLGAQQLNVRTRLLEAYRVLAFPQGAVGEQYDLFSAGRQGPLLECFRVDFGEVPDGAPGRGRRNPRQSVAEGPILQCLRLNQKLVPEPTSINPVVLAPAIVRRPPLWQAEERRLSTEAVWDRLRREPELPLILRQTELLPTFRAGLTAQPDATWTYYDQAAKRVYTAENAAELAAVLAADHFLYDPQAAVEDRILPVRSISTADIWSHLWPREGAEQIASVSARAALEASAASPHFPVQPTATVLWQGLQEGVRENRWVLYLSGPNLAIGAAELAEWSATPRFDEQAIFWTYQAALDQGFYPRRGTDGGEAVPLTAEALRDRCWPTGVANMTVEELERTARGIWYDLTRPRLEMEIRDGVERGIWGLWRQGADETFYVAGDSLPTQTVDGDWNLVASGASLRTELEAVRPGRGPQPAETSGTPREALTQAWEQLGSFRDVEVAELELTAKDRDTLDNTLLATWPDRPSGVNATVSVWARGGRAMGGRPETVELSYEGRFDEVRAMLAPIWPFERQGELDVTISVRITLEPGCALTNPALETYRAALMNANQGVLAVRLVPRRTRQSPGAN